MKDTLRCRIAFIIGSLPKSRGFDRPTRLYDYDTNKYIPMNIVYCNETYGLYDYNTKTYLYGNDSYMYDCETNDIIILNPTDSALMGMITNSKSYFKYRINNSMVSIYDYDTNKYHNYIIN